jgi:hypothetical protein
MIQSSELTGGAGFTFEGTVVATYLALLLIEAAPRGLRGRKTVRVAVQQAAFGEPLDDLVVDAEAPDGTTARISLQIKTQLTISAARSNTDFREIVVNAWNTVLRDRFRDGVDRVGAATNSMSDAAARALERVCELARDSTTAGEFASRFVPGAGEGQKLRETVQVFRAILGELAGQLPTEAELHRLLRHFTILRFDLLHEGGRDEATAVEILRPGLHPKDASRADDLWYRLRVIAREAAGRAGGFTRSSLLEHLDGRFRLAGALSLREDIGRLEAEAELALKDIGATIDGVEVERTSLITLTDQAAISRRFVQLNGLPGSGKSAVLRAAAMRRRTVGPVIVLKSDRLSGRGWPDYAQSVGLNCTDPYVMLLELAAIGTPTLVVDGLDRIAVPNRGIVIDVVNTILQSPTLASWRIIASLRDSGSEHLRTWLPDGLFSQGGVSIIDVESFDNDEAEELLERLPRLRSLLFATDERVRKIARRPFFANVLARSMRAGNATEPTSELDLVDAWWRRGGYAAEGADATRRQRALMSLANEGATTLGRKMQSNDIDADTLNDLIADGILADVRIGHTAKFTHDIFFEWSFLQLLISTDKEWRAEIRTAGEPPVLGRVVELLSQLVFTKEDDWESHLNETETAGMRPQWTRAWLFGPFGAPAFAERAAVFDNAVFRDNARRFARLVIWFQAEKTRANPQVLNGTLIEQGLTRSEIVSMADALAWPSDLLTWSRFCQWLLDSIPRCPVETVSNIVSAFEIWQNISADRRNLISQRIAETAVRWLCDIEDRQHPEEFSYNPGFWQALRNNELDELERRLRQILLRAARTLPELVRTYLQRVRERDRLRHHAFERIIMFSPTLVSAHAKELVDLCLLELLGELPRIRFERAQSDREWHNLNFYSDWHDLTIHNASRTFSPPSPLREPFLSLFKVEPPEALRLVRFLCNHAVTAWRQLHELDPGNRDVPIPLVLVLPWGRQTFWGDVKVYGWFRGVWGPSAVQCALMALESWAFAQVASGRDIDDVIRDVVSGNDCSAVLGIAVALAIAHKHVAASTLPLAISQRLWRWDVQRCFQDSKGLQPNIIGFAMTGEESPHSNAVRASNTTDYRRLDIRSLAMLFTIAGDEALRAACRAALERFPTELPFDFGSWGDDDRCVAQLRRTAEIWSKIGSIETYTTVRTDDGSLLIKHENPHSRDEDVAEAARRLEETNTWAGLQLWADDCFKEGQISERMSLTEALARARSLDYPALFAPHEGDEGLGDMRRGAVAGAAAAAVCFGSPLEEKDLAWCRNVIERSGKAHEAKSPLWDSRATIPWHSCIYAARGFAGLIRLGIDADAAKRHLIGLAVHPLEQVSEEAIASAFSCWDNDPNFAWVTLDLGLKLSILPQASNRPGYGFDPTADTDRRNRLADQVLSGLQGAEPLITLQRLPPAWVHAPYPETRIGGIRRRKVSEPVWREPDDIWRWDFAPKVLSRIPIERVLADELRRPPFLALCNDLLAWTIERLAPSWEDDDRRGRERRSADVLEWRAQLFRFFGRTAANIEGEEARRRFIDPVVSLEDELCASLLEPLVDIYICAAVFDSDEISPGASGFLSACVERMLQDRALRNAANWDGYVHGHYLPGVIRSLFFVRHEAGGAVRFANGDWSEVAFVLPIIDPILVAVGAVADVMRSFLTLCEHAIAHYPAERFVEQLLAVLGDQPGIPTGWRGTTILGRIAALVHAFAERTLPLPHSLAEKMLRILDILVDMGDRRAAALQTSEIFKDVRPAVSPA